jgi:hypothetical protein
MKWVLIVVLAFAKIVLADAPHADQDIGAQLEKLQKAIKISSPEIKIGRLFLVGLLKVHKNIYLLSI